MADEKENKTAESSEGSQEAQAAVADQPKPAESKASEPEKVETKESSPEKEAPEPAAKPEVKAEAEADTEDVEAKPAKAEVKGVEAAKPVEKDEAKAESAKEAAPKADAVEKKPAEKKEGAKPAADKADAEKAAPKAEAAEKKPAEKKPAEKKEAKPAEKKEAKPAADKADAKKEAAAKKPAAKKKAKPPKLEDKPFEEFVKEHYLPELEKALVAQGMDDLTLSFAKEPVAVGGLPGAGLCSQVIGNWFSGDREFRVYFPKDDIKGIKTFSYAETGSSSSILESFLIDERKVTLDLLVSGVVLRLQAQKWIGRN
ncbi:MAG: DUF2996 domain-containing protein [Cyanobacteria bacterium P01_D01_bin.73]